jgi:hypothetical protein
MWDARKGSTGDDMVSACKHVLSPGSVCHSSAACRHIQVLAAAARQGVLPLSLVAINLVALGDRMAPSHSSLHAISLFATLPNAK